MIVEVEGRLDEASVLHLEDRTEAIRIRLVGAEEAKVLLIGVLREDIPQHRTERTRRLALLGPRLLDRDRVRREVGHRERHAHGAAVGVRVRSHASLGARC